MKGDALFLNPRNEPKRTADGTDTTTEIPMADLKFKVRFEFQTSFQIQEAGESILFQTQSLNICISVPDFIVTRQSNP